SCHPLGPWYLGMMERDREKESLMKRWLHCFVVVFALRSPAALLAADSNTLVGLHFWGDRNDSAPATLLNSASTGGYDLEIVNTGNPQWNDVDVVNPLYQNFKNTYKVTPITRLGYYWGNTLPVPGSPEYS